MTFVSQFLDRAEDLFATAQAAAGEDCNWSLVVGADGAIQVLDRAAWAPDRLREHLGARAIYRVNRTGGRVRVEGASRGQRCLLQAETPAAWASQALRDEPRYRIEA